MAPNSNAPSTLAPQEAVNLIVAQEAPEPFVEIFFHPRLDYVGLRSRWGLFEADQWVPINRTQHQFVDSSNTTFALEDPTLSREHLELRWSPRAHSFEVRKLKDDSLPIWLAPLSSPLEEQPLHADQPTRVPPDTLLRIGNRVLLHLAVGVRDDALADSTGRMIGRSPQLLALRKDLNNIAEAAPQTNVMIVGETGVGKEVVARSLHQLTAGTRPFVGVNMAESPQLVESALFGHKRGAFSGATNDRDGAFVTAEMGCVFLDEIADLPLDAQAKLLRALQDKEFRPVGSDRVRPLKARILSATSKNIDEPQSFRSDLKYRLSTLAVTVPPSRARKSDLPLLFVHLLRAAAEDSDATSVWFNDTYTDVRLSARHLSQLLEYDWPGNVRELFNAVIALNVHKDPNRVLSGLLRAVPVSAAIAPGVSADLARDHGLPGLLTRFEWRLDDLSRHLGLSRKALENRARREGLWPPSRETFVELLRADGWSVEALHQRTGLSKFTLNKWAEEHGLKKAADYSHAELRTALAAAGDLAAAANSLQLTARAFEMRLRAAPNDET